MKSKSFLIFGIIMWSVLAIFLTGILISFVSAKSFLGILDNKFNWNNKNFEVVKEESFNPSDFENININWTDGNVYIYKAIDDKITVIEKTKGVKDSQLTITTNNKTLNLEQRRRSFQFFNFGYRLFTMEVMLPEKEYNEIKLKGTSGKLEIEDILAESFELKINSGKIVMSNIEGENLKSQTTSGSVNIDGKFENINAEITSGSLNLDLATAPKEIKIEMTSGMSKVTIPENDGFTLYESKTSGIFKTDFNVDDFGVYKNGENKYSFKMTSGTIKLLRSGF